MNRILKITFIFIFASIIILPVFARTATDEVSYDGRKYDMKFSDINQLNHPITNFGIFGQNVQTDGSGTYWPAGFPAETYIFGAGIWIGAKVDIDGDGIKDTLVTCGYNPNSGATEMVPGDGEDGPAYSNAYERVYRSTDDWPPMDANGTIIFDSIVSMQDLYCEFSDFDESVHFEEVNLPLGIKVKLTTYAWVGPLKEDIVFMRYQIINANSDSLDLDSVFMGICADNDIGNEAGSAANDLLGFVPELNMGYQFQLDDEAGWKHKPGIIAYKYMESPKATYDIDTDHDGTVDVLAGEEIGMTTFNKFTLATDPGNKDERYQVLAGYNHLEFDPNAPELSYSPFPTDTQWTGTPGYPGISESADEAGDKRFVMASGPFTLNYGDTVNIVVAIMVARNVDELAPKAEAAQSIYDAGFKGPEAPTQVKFSIKGLDKKAVLYWSDNAEQKYDSYYDLVSDPTSPLYNPAYRKYDVEGYNVYRSRTGAGGTWELLAKYDKINDFTIEKSDSFVYYDSLGTKYIEYEYCTVGSNTGIPYMYIDTGLVNGLTYYYKITAYDYNFDDYWYTTDSLGNKIPTLDADGNPIGASPSILEGAGYTHAVIPRNPTSNYDAPVDTLTLLTTFTNDIGDTLTRHPIDTSLTWDVELIVDTLIKERTVYTIKFDSILYTPSFINKTTPAYKYSVYKNTNNGEEYITSNIMYMDTVSLVIGGEVKSYMQNYGDNGIAFDGIALKVDKYYLTDANWPDKTNYYWAKNFTGSYDTSIVKIEYPSDMRFFHGSKIYRFEWRDTIINSITNLTVDVWDVQNNIQIPFGNDSIGDFWHFSPLRTGTFSQFINDSSSRNELTGINFCGFQLYFNMPTFPFSNPMNWADRPQDGDVWTITLTPNDSTIADYQYPPIGAQYQLIVTPYKYVEPVESLLAEVKVVPNPYVVRSEFGQDYNHRKIYFTNLPNQCTIQIYTLAGELIKTIEHNVEFDYVSATDTTTVIDVTNGAATWDVLTDNDQIPAAGLYLFRIETPDGASYIGKFALIK